MGTHLQFIQGIPVEADTDLSQKEIVELVFDTNLSWSWEGRQLGRIEISQAEEFIQLCVYEKPITKFITLKKI